MSYKHPPNLVRALPMRIAQSLKIGGKFLLLALTGVGGFCFGVGFYTSFPASLATVPVGVAGIICAIKSTKWWLRAFFSIPALVSGALWIGHWVDPMTGYRVYEWSACPFAGPFTSHLVSRQRDPSTGDVLLYFLDPAGILAEDWRVLRFHAGSRFPQRDQLLESLLPKQRLFLRKPLPGEGPTPGGGKP
jgi:hypothetical protein